MGSHRDRGAVVVATCALVVGALACGDDTGSGDTAGTGAATGVGTGASGSNTTSTTGSGASSTSATGTGGGGMLLECETPVGPGLPAGAPVLVPGVWTDITPWNEIPKPGSPPVEIGNPEHIIAQGIAIDPCNPAVLYWGNTPFQDYGGLFRSVDAGGSWQRVGQLESPLHARIDPEDTMHLYAGDGVRGGTLGFWVSHDGGETWAIPPAFDALAQETGFFIHDVYDVAVDPTDFDHVLVSSHSPWGGDAGNAAGVLESTDGGASWIAHMPEPTWGAGHSINFLYDPAQGIGDARTWLLGTQGDGQWRTTDGGTSWTKVTDDSIFHGGADTYHAKNGVLYTTSVAGTLRSTDNGATFVNAGSGQGNTGVWGDGETLYTAPAYGFGMQPMVTSPETDGTTWTPGAQTFDGSGPFEIAFDPTNRILYASMWFQGVWAMKL